MNHIKIEQNNNIEVVSKELIEELYNAAQDCDASSNMTGNLQTTKAYKRDVDFLTAKFPGLTINATQGLYVDFADRGVEQALASTIGDGTGVTTVDILGVTNLNGSGNAAGIKGNTDIESFDEFILFQNCTTVSGAFARSSLKSIGIPKSVTLFSYPCDYGLIFERVILEDVDAYVSAEHNGGKIRVGEWNVGRKGYYYLKNSLTGQIEKMTTLNVSSNAHPNSLGGRGVTFNWSTITNVNWNAEFIPSGCFGGCLLDSVILGEGVMRILDSVFNEAGVSYIDLPSTITSIGEKAFRRNKRTMTMVCRATTPPTVSTTENNLPSTLYVPDASISAYESATWFDGMASGSIKGLSELPSND